MSHETLKLNRHEKYDPDEGEILVSFKYHAGMPERGPTYSCGGTPAEPDEIEILKIEAGQDESGWSKGQDITDLITEQEYDYIESQLYDNWRADMADNEADYRYEQYREERDRE